MDYNADYELDNSISIIDNDILLIDCKDNYSEVKTLSSKKYHYKKKSGISAGAIVAIVLIPIVIVGLVIGLIYFIRNKNTENSKAPETTNEAINITN